MVRQCRLAEESESSMFFLITSKKTRPAAGLKPCAGVVVCGGQVGIAMHQAAPHAINPRDAGRSGLM